MYLFFKLIYIKKNRTKEKIKSMVDKKLKINEFLFDYLIQTYAF